MNHKPTVYTAFDNRNGEMIPILSSDLFDCVYEPEFRDVRQAYLMSLRTEAKNEEAIKSGRTFLCGCCKRPLKIVGDINGKNCFHFKHIDILPEGECDYYDKVKYTKEEIKAMIFNGRTESLEHRQTKAAISLALENEPNIRQVAVEKVAKKVGKTWRKPDIRADFDDKTVVLEVQLSPIFPYVTLERNDAYRDNGWYICWIFDDVNEDHPIMRELDAWVNNNYNLFGFDDEAKAATEKSGRLHLTVKYYVFNIIEDGLNSRLCGKWQTETVQFSDLTFDADQRMVYLHDSNSEKQECIERIECIISECKKEIEEAERLAQLEIERKKEEERKRLIEEQRIEEERQRIHQEKEDVINFIYNIPEYNFPSEMFRLTLEYLGQIDKEGIMILLSSIEANIKYFETDAINKWLKVVCEIVKQRGEGVQTAKYLWNEVIYKFEESGNKILHLSLKDFFSVMGISDYSRALKLLMRPIDDETSDWLSSISVSDKYFEYYAPLIILNRYYRANRHIPERIANFFADNTREIWCLISAQIGKPFGYKDLQNLKQISNLVWNSYPHISQLFIYLIERNGLVHTISDVKYKNGKPQKSQYQKLKELIDSQKNQPLIEVTLEDLEIIFPAKRETKH